MTTEIQQVSQIEQLETSLATEKARLRDLAMMGTVITSIHEIDAVLSVVMDMAIRLADGEVGMILLGENSDLEAKISWGLTEDFARSLMYKDDLDLAAYCVKNGETVILTDLEVVSEEGIKLKSVIAVPIKQSGRCLGAMLMINKAGGGNYTADDQDILELLFSFAAVAVDNSNLMQDRLMQQKMNQEMAIAKQIQETLLPDSMKHIRGAEIGAVYFPAREVGGDFYDIIRIDDTKFLTVLGDVSNKGVPAALIMSALSGVLKTTLRNNPNISVSELTETLNNIMAQEIIKEREMFVTLFISKFDLEAMRLTHCNAGHPSGLYWEEAARTVHQLTATGPILGQFPGIAYKQGERTLAREDRLFLFTDGLTEATDAEDRLFGTERVEQVLSMEIDLPPEEFCHKVKEWVDRFAEGAAEETYDDFTLVQVRVE